MKEVFIIKTTKRITSLLFTLCIICSLLIPTTAFAATCECGREIPDEMVLAKTGKDESLIQTPDKLTYANEKGYPVTVDGEAINFARKGVIEVDECRYTYGTSREAYHPDTADWYLCDDGIYRTADGYIVVASKDYEKNTVIWTPFGEGIVLDACGASNLVSIYTNY